MKPIDTLPLPDRILFAAFITFVERGYDTASMDEVAAAAQTTKRTVYAHFGNKESLFRAAIGNAVQRFLSELPTPAPDGDPETELVDFLCMFSELATWRRSVLLQRVVIGAADRMSDLGALLHRDVIGAAEGRIAAFLTARFVALPGAEPDWTTAAARLLLNMATGPQRFATLMEARAPAPQHPLVARDATDAAWVRRAVRLFLAGLAATASPRPRP